ncbi:MAG: LysM peptidoglycan-binding domain-containing protein [Oscillibacter sp.]|nr:LysM peptidoglycan-binding domain-containing protein [Oscillibacter sp.]
MVEEGDCLWSIARRFYGTGTKWNVIYEANKATMKDADTLDVGQVLTIPEL